MSSKLPKNETIAIFQKDGYLLPQWVNSNGRPTGKRVTLAQAELVISVTRMEGYRPVTVDGQVILVRNIARNRQSRYLLLDGEKVDVSLMINMDNDTKRAIIHFIDNEQALTFKMKR